METISAAEFEKRYGAGSTASFGPPTPAKEPGYFSRVGSGISQAFSGIRDTLSSVPQQPTLRDEVRAGLSVARDATGIALVPIAEAPVIKQIGEAFGMAGEKISNVLMENPQYEASFTKLSQFLDENPEIGDAIALAGNVGAIQGGAAGASRAARGAKNAAASTGQAIANAGDEALRAGTDLKSRVQTTIARRNAHPQLQQSAERLNDADPFFVSGTKRLDNPLTAYDEFLDRSKKALGDIKEDPAISVVGEEIGDAFQSVVSQRRAVGEVMGAELKKVGGLKIGVAAPRETLLAELRESGLAYNSRSKQLTSFSGSRFADAEVRMLQEYVARFQKLGDTPTVRDIDNFVAKSRSTLDFLKGESGVIGTTNAERIINGNIRSLKDALDPARNGTPALREYWEANRTYSDLSDFVDEGSGFLGKVTQEGDFAKDASLAKSAVQSVLNNGKKDWLLRLEALTNYPALDRSVLALQAMKDAGDFRGLSLLQQLSEGAVPLSKSGLIDKILQLGISKAGEVILGPAEEQTRAFLRSLVKEPQTPPAQ